MTSRPRTTAAIKLLALSVLLIAAGYTTAFFPAVQQAGAWIMAMGVVLNAVAALGLGALRGGGHSAGSRSRALVVTLAGTGAVLAAGFSIALSQGEISAATPLLGGLPRPTALLLIIVGLIPLFVLPLIYAFTFRTHVLTDADLARVMAAAKVSQHKPADR